MQWDNPLLDSLLHTIGIAGGVAVLSTGIALLLVLTIFWVRIAAWPIAIVLLSTFLAIPLYVQATAWSAGFGDYGWLRLSQVTAARNPWLGIASVIWIHTCGILPSCFWILAIGSHRARTPSFELSLLENGPLSAITRHALVNMRPWIVLSLLWACSSVQSDMVVTNLFQVPTLCESIYQQVQFGRIRSAPIAASVAISLSCGLALAILAYRFAIQPNPQAPMEQGRGLQLRKSSYRTWSLVSWLIISLVSILPWCNLLSRLGWSTTLDGNKPIRTWSTEETLNSLWHIQDFSEEFQWSLQLCSWTALLSLLISIFLLAISKRTMLLPITFAILGCMIALPGPLINLAVSKLMLGGLPESLSWLYDQTLLPPILALQFRTLPIAFGSLWLAWAQYQRKYKELLAIESLLTYRWKLWIACRWMLWPTLATWTIAFTVAFGELSSYLLVQPPGVTTIAMRMFDLLHYGTKNREAALALFLAILGSLPCLILIILLRNNQKTLRGSGTPTPEDRPN
jgi:ABC-type Fe3+ transport system permease subunit